ncbi:MAG: hypothetical protein M0Z28_12140, partial [Rhodospirillales bacterium]|nr:hypothetical protein [Rhodospirillales bacterium]
RAPPPGLCGAAPRGRCRRADPYRRAARVTETPRDAAVASFFFAAAAEIARLLLTAMRERVDSVVLPAHARFAIRQEPSVLQERESVSADEQSACPHAGPAQQEHVAAFGRRKLAARRASFRVTRAADCGTGHGGGRSDEPRYLPTAIREMLDVSNDDSTTTDGGRAQPLAMRAGARRTGGAGRGTRGTTTRKTTTRKTAVKATTGRATKATGARKTAAAKTGTRKAAPKRAAAATAKSTRKTAGGRGTSARGTAARKTTARKTAAKATTGRTAKAATGRAAKATTGRAVKATAGRATKATAGRAAKMTTGRAVKATAGRAAKATTGRAVKATGTRKTATTRKTPVRRAAPAAPRAPRRSRKQAADTTMMETMTPAAENAGETPSAEQQS